MSEFRITGITAVTNAIVDPITLTEVASVAKTRARKEVWDYYECGADSQTVLHENENAFKA